jgi:hypothetical protein
MLSVRRENQLCCVTRRACLGVSLLFRVIFFGILLKLVGIYSDRSEVLTTVMISLPSSGLWRRVVLYPHIKLHVHTYLEDCGSVKINKICFYKTTVLIYQNKRRHIPGDRNLWLIWQESIYHGIYRSGCPRSNGLDLYSEGVRFKSR